MYSQESMSQENKFSYPPDSFYNFPRTLESTPRYNPLELGDLRISPGQINSNQLHNTQNSGTQNNNNNNGGAYSSSGLNNQQNDSLNTAVNVLLSFLSKVIGVGFKPSYSQVRAVLLDDDNEDINSSNTWFKFLVERLVRVYKHRDTFT